MDPMCFLCGIPTVELQYSQFLKWAPLTLPKLKRLNPMMLDNSPTSAMHKKTPPKFRQTSRFFLPLFLSVPKIGAKFCVPTNKIQKLTSTKWKCCASRARSTWGCHVVSVESAKRSSVAVNSNSRTKSDLRYSPVMFVFALKKTWELCACGLFSRWRKTKSSQTSTKKWNDLKSCFT